MTVNEENKIVQGFREAKISPKGNKTNTLFWMIYLLHHSNSLFIAKKYAPFCPNSRDLWHLIPLWWQNICLWYSLIMLWPSGDFIPFPCALSATSSMGQQNWRPWMVCCSFVSDTHTHSHIVISSFLHDWYSSLRHQ